MKSVNIKILAIITLAIQSGFSFAEKYETPSFFNEATQKSISFKDKVTNKETKTNWKDSYTMDQDDDSESSKRLPSSKNSKVKYWDYENKK